MPSPKLTKAQAAKQLAATKERFQEKAKDPVGILRAPMVPKTLKQMSDKTKQMLPKALDLCDAVLDGKEDITKMQFEAAKYVMNLASSVAKAELEFKAATLKYKVDMTKAVTEGVIKNTLTQDEIREQANGLQAVDENFSMDFEEDEEDDE